MLVVDVDGQVGEATAGTLGLLSEPTLTARTGKGRHLYFRFPAATDIGNRARVNGCAVDIRGDGGYVVAPPSRHANGTDYQWTTTGIAPAEPPEWLVELIEKPKPASPCTSPPANRQRVANSGGTPYGRQALEDAKIAVKSSGRSRVRAA